MTHRKAFGVFTFKTKKAVPGQKSYSKHSSHTSEAVLAFGHDCGGSDALSSKFLSDASLFLMLHFFLTAILMEKATQFCS